jgi:hypothetical protein
MLSAQRLRLAATSGSEYAKILERPLITSAALTMKVARTCWERRMSLVNDTIGVARRLSLFFKVELR